MAPRRLGGIGQTGHRAIVDDLAAALRVEGARRGAGERDAVADEMRLVEIAGRERDVGPDGVAGPIGGSHGAGEAPQARGGFWRDARPNSGRAAGIPAPPSRPPRPPPPPAPA